MRLPKRGQKGFTLIELLIVVAILGVLAAVVIPNIQQFIGAGETEARETDYTTVQSAVHAMMLDNGISEIPGAIVYAAAGTAVNQMVFTTGTPNTGFPDPVTTAAVKDAKDGIIAPATLYTQDGYTLYGHQIAYDSDADGDVDAVKLVSYVVMGTSEYYYTCEKDGTVRQFDGADIATAEEFTY